jgi:hypothetical protein
MKRLGYLPMLGMLAVALSGCMSSGVVDMGHDKYNISFNSLGGGVNARAWAYAEAADVCKKQGKKVLGISEGLSEAGGSSTVSLTFKCVNQEDPELKKRLASAK